MDSSDEPTIWWLAGDTPDDLLAQLEVVAPQLQAHPGDDTEGGRRVIAGTGPARLGIVAPDDRKVRLARRLVTKGAPWRGRSDIWFTPAGLAQGRPTDEPVGQPGTHEPSAPADDPGKVAFLFPGVEPGFGAGAIDLPRLAGRLGLDAPTIEDDTVAHRSASIYRLGIFLDQALRKLGIAPDVIAGHSIGEWSGAVAAGILPLSHADELLGTVDLEAIELPAVDFAALAAGASAVAPVLDEIDGVDLSHDNCTNQSVICGPPALVDDALARLRSGSILGYKLDFQSGFHTPAAAPLAELFRQAVADLPFGPGDVPLWSANTVAPYPTPKDEFIALQLRHLVEPVRFRELIERLYHDAGVRVFIQAGIGSLTSFVDDTLADHDHASIQLVTQKHSALDQAHRALTALWVEGVDLDQHALTPQQTAPVAPDAVEDVDRMQHAVAPQPTAPAASRAPVAPAASREPVALLEPASSSPASGGPTSSGPVSSSAVIEAANLVAAAARASQDVIGALAARLSPPVAARTSQPVSSAAATSPAATRPANGTPVTTPEITTVGAAPSAWPTAKVTVERHMSLETMPETLDHSLLSQPDTWPDPAERFPIVAMTTQIQLLQEIAEDHADGRKVIEISGVRNSRWLDLSDPQDVEITLSPKSDDQLAMALGNSCRAQLRVGELPPAPPPEVEPLTNPHPAQHTPAEMFEQMIMFHGPRFWGINALGPLGDNGMSGDFEHLDTPGSLLDNLGKLIAYWVMDLRNWGEAALPISVDRIQWFGPEPPPGTEVHCEIRIVELRRDGVKADGVLVLPDGTLLCKVDGWTSIVFHRDELVEPFYYNTSRRDLIEPQPGGWSIVQERWPTGPGRELTARRYLSRAEQGPYSELNLLQQRRQLIDVVAAKDSVRRWLLDTYDIPSFPIEIALVAEDERHYRARSPLIPDGHDLCIAVSSADWMTVAILGDGRYYDIETELIPEGSDPDEVADAVAAKVKARNPEAQVLQACPVDNLIPSRLDVPPQAPFAVAWTAKLSEAEGGSTMADTTAGGH